MTEQRAKEILVLYRPDAPDANDPELQEALELAQKSPELGAWFQRHCEVQTALREKLREIAVPEGLKEQILSEFKSHTAARTTRRRLALALATLVLFVAVGAFWFSTREEPYDVGMDAYRMQMVRTVLRAYGMDLETNNVAEIRSYLSQQHAPADFALPEPLEKTTLTGCGVLQWQGSPVSMICFSSGKPLEPGRKSDVYLFVIDEKNLNKAPDEGKIQITPENRTVTASWSRGGKTYLLAAEGDESFLRRFL